MRAVTAEEIENIAGGLAKKHPNAGAHPMSQPLPTITVTGTMPSTGGGIIGGGGGGGPPAHGTGPKAPGDPPPPSPTVGQQEFDNALKAALEEAGAGLLDSDIAGDVFTATDYAEMAANIGANQFQDAVDSYDSFERYGDNSYEVPQYAEYVHWDRVDWNAYSENGTASPQVAIQNFFHDVNVNHHVSLTPTSSWSS